MRKTWLVINGKKVAGFVMDDGSVITQEELDKEQQAPKPAEKE